MALHSIVNSLLGARCLTEVCGSRDRFGLSKGNGQKNRLRERYLCVQVGLGPTFHAVCVTAGSFLPLCWQRPHLGIRLPTKSRLIPENKSVLFCTK